MSLTDPNAVYRLGPAGALVDLPGIRFGSAVSSDVVFPAAIHTSLAGTRTRDRLGPRKRSWSFTWQFLFLAEMGSIESVLESRPLYLDDPLATDVMPVQVVLDSYSREFITPFEANVSLTVLEV